MVRKGDILMGITPKDPANFTPGMGTYTELKPFRFWCQKVLPLVYDDSLSYYEVLCKVVDFLNKTMEDVGVLHDDVEALNTAYQQLQAYVNDYFSTLDVQQEINHKLDIMAADGTLDALLLPYFNAYKAEINQIIAGQNTNINNFKLQVNDTISQQNQRISTQDSNISTLTSRMDSFAHLAEGSTTGDAELIDIRVSYGGKTYPSAGDAVRSIGSNIVNNVLPQTGQSVDLTFTETSTGITTDIYMNSNKTYNIKNTTSEGGTMVTGTLFIEGHNDNTVAFPAARNATVNFTPQYDGYLRLYCSAGSKAGITIVGADEITENNITNLSNALNFKDINVSTGSYLTGSAIGDSVTVINNAPAWCRTITPVYVAANTAVRCKTRANGSCCIAVSQDNNIANAKVAVLASNDSAITEYTYYAETACYVFISGRAGETSGYTINGSLIGQELKILENALDFNLISTYPGQYLTGSAGGSVTVISNAPNWCRTITPVAVKAGSIIKCKTRGNGNCCIAVSSDSNIANAIVAVVASDDTSINEYVYTATSDCYAFISGRVNETEGYVINSAMDDTENMKDYFGFDKINGLQPGHYIMGTTIDQTVELSGTNLNWCYTPVGTFVKAGKLVKCRTRGSGFCCIAVASTNNFSSAIVKAVGDDNTKVKEYTFSANSDCYVFISGRVNETVGYIVDSMKEEIETYIVPSGGSFSGLIKSLAGNDNEKIIYVEEGEYDVYEELGGDDFIATIDDPLNTNWRDVNAIVPPNTTIIGRGNVTLKFAPTAQQIGSDGMAFLFSPLNISGNCSIENITVYGKNCRYAIHDESSGLSTYANTVHKYKNVRAKKEHGSYGGIQCFGSGMGARSIWDFDSCEFISDRTNVWTVHTTTSSQDDSSSIILNNCIIIKENTESADGALQLIVGGSGHNAKQNFVRLNSCYIAGSVEITTASAVTQKFDVTALKSSVIGGFDVSDMFTENPYPVKQYS